MNLIRSLIGRRQFLISLLTSIIAISFGRVAKSFGFIFGDRSARASGTIEKKGLRGIVVYYSATGSTAKVANAIYLGMKGVIDCDVAPINKIDPKEMAKYDVVAIGGPIWYNRATANLLIFASKMPHMAGKLCALFCTHGIGPNGIFYSLMQPLRNKDLTVIGWNDWYGGASHVLHKPSPYFTDGHPDTVDLVEAEAFGKEWAERAVRIYAGERNLIPELPNGPDADPLWLRDGRGDASSRAGAGGRMQGAGAAGTSPMGMPGGSAAAGPGGGTPVATAAAGAAAARTVAATSGPGGAMPGAGAASGGQGTGSQVGVGQREPPRQLESIPIIDTAKCVYPRCTACVDNCLVHAIDLSMMSPAVRVSSSSMFVQGCIHCSHPLCERSCVYDAITYEQSKTKHVIDMKKCTYPKCTLCIDRCTMDSIDFSQESPVFHNNCEGCDLCWCICPTGAIEITNVEETHMRLMDNPATRNNNTTLVQEELLGRFRRLLPFNEIGWDNIVFTKKNAPRIVLDEKAWPYSVK